MQPWAPAGIFPGGGGANLWGGAPKKSVKGGPHFFRQALKYMHLVGGGGVGSFDARRVFF